MMEQEISVGMLVAATHQGANAVLLQQRAREDTWPRACQLTAHGKVNLNELRFPDARALSHGLLREVGEELGPTMAHTIAGAIMARQIAIVIEQAERELGSGIREMLCMRFKSNPHTLELLRSFVTDKKIVLSFGINSAMEAEELRSLIEGETDVRFRICTKHDQLLPLEKKFKTELVPENEIRMFPDEIEAVQEGFQRLFAVRSGVSV